MLSTTAFLKGRFLAIPRPERFTSLRARPWYRWEETDVFHIKPNRYIDILATDGDGQHALRIGASTGGVDITGSFQWREATEGRKNEVLLAVRRQRESQMDVVMFGYILPAAYVVAAPLAIWYGNTFLDFAAAIAGVVVTAAYQYASDLKDRYATPRWLAKHLDKATVHGVDNHTLEIRDPRSLFTKDADADNEDGGNGDADTADTPGTGAVSTEAPVPPPATGPTSGAEFLSKI